MNDYPFFIPPAHLAARKPRDWSKSEADEYRNWLVSSVEERVTFLLEFLGVSSKAKPEELLENAGRKAVEQLNNDVFSEPGPRGKRLSNKGYALAADMGLLVAKLLLENYDNRVYWHTIRRPKRELSYNLPVLEGFDNNYLDPIGGSTAEANGVLCGRRDESIWKDIYVFWSKHVADEQKENC